MKKTSKLLLLSTLLISLVACGENKTEEKKAEAKVENKEINIGVTFYKYDDNFIATVRKSMDDISKNMGLKLSMVDSQNSQSAQNEQIDVFLSKGVDALAVNLVDPAAAETVLQKIKAKNLPVIFYNKEPNAEVMNSYDKIYFVGTDSKESGVIQGELVAKKWAANADWDLNKDGKIQYVLLKGEPGHPDAEARTEWVVKTLNSKGIATEELNMDTAMWDTAQAKDKMDAWISGPNKDKIEVVIANNDAMAFGAIEALKAAGKTSIPVFGVDAIPEALSKIESGELAGTVLNDGKNQAKATLEIAKNLAQGKPALEGTEWKLIDNNAIRVPYVAVDKDNVANFK